MKDEKEFNEFINKVRANEIRIKSSRLYRNQPCGDNFVPGIPGDWCQDCWYAGKCAATCIEVEDD